VAKLVDGAAIKLVGGNEIVARPHQGVEDQQLGGVAGGGGERGGAAFKRGNALLEHGLGRVHDASVDVAERLQPEQGGGVVDVVEDEGGGLVDRRGARAGCRVRLRAGMDGKCIESGRALNHLLSP
jgi:hypothetical protein